ncbi:MAG: hypothetical protein FJW23_12845 [Acidimicrobiia bacterium]|nr:hypothetical protein [Acidimicrobiia bacterium]
MVHRLQHPGERPFDPRQVAFAASGIVQLPFTLDALDGRSHQGPCTRPRRPGDGAGGGLEAVGDRQGRGLARLGPRARALASNAP